MNDLQRNDFMQEKQWYFLLLFSMTFSHSIWATSLNEIDSTKKFIVLSDIHFDPFDSCNDLPRPCSTLSKLQATDYQKWDEILANASTKMASFTEDTNYPLLLSTL